MHWNVWLLYHDKQFTGGEWHHNKIKIFQHVLLKKPFFETNITCIIAYMFG